jgi:hypothetical protein
MDSSPVGTYLLQLDQQLAAALQDLTAVDDLSLWARPAPQEWSPAEHLSHVAAVHHFFRRVNQLLWPISSQMARRRVHHPYQAIIDDVYARPTFPHAIGRLWPPRHSYRRPVSLPRLTGEIREEHRLLRAFYRTKDEKILGHAPLYYPSIGWINFTQSLRIAVFHDAHHFAAIREALAPGGGGHPHVA